MMWADELKGVTLLLASLTEAVAGLVIAVAVVEAACRTAVALPALMRTVQPERSHITKEDIRLRLGRWLALALELELGADILRTAIAPTWSEIGQLAAIAAVRTALNYFLQKEIDGAAERAGRSLAPVPVASPTSTHP